MGFLDNGVWLFALTLGVFTGSRALQRHTGLVLLNPILLTIIVIIVYLHTSGVEYSTYSASCRYIDFWLKPAIVALGVPLYRQLEAIQRQWLPLLVSEIAGCIAGIVSVVILAELLGASEEVVMSLVPKAVTTPIAIEVSRTIGGIPALTASVVICTGIFGAMAGFRILRLLRIDSGIAGGLSIGTASHAIGTSAAMEKGYRYGAYSSLGLILNGLLTSLLAPYVLQALGYSF